MPEHEGHLLGGRENPIGDGGAAQRGKFPHDLRPDECEGQTHSAQNCPCQKPDASQNGAVDVEWQARNLAASLSRASRKSCKPGYTDGNLLLFVYQAVA